jgi:hypothetical protein
MFYVFGKHIQVQPHLNSVTVHTPVLETTIPASVFTLCTLYPERP